MAWRGRAVVLGVGLCVALAGLMAAGQESVGREAAGQAAAPQGPTFRSGVNLVRVDVSVTGRDGKAIADLQPSDFEIEEDGVAQTAETVQFLHLDGQPLPGSNESLDIRSQDHARMEAARDDVRIFAIFFDEYHVDKAPSITLPMREALEAFITMLGPSDLVATMDPLTPLSALKFTRDRRELLDWAKNREGRHNQWVPTRSVLEEAQLTQRNPGELRAAVSLSALNALVTYLGGLREGRKSVLFVSQGPPVWPSGNGLQQRLDEALQSANRANVTINVFDPRSLGSAPFGGADSLAQMSNETGGRRIVNSNAPERELTRIVEDASAYYLVGYTPARDFADGKFHKVEVRVKRRGARVEARRGYWAPKAAELTAAAAPEPDVDPELRESLKQFSRPGDGQAVDLWIGLSRGSAGRTRVTISWDQAGRVAATGLQDAGREPAARLAVEPRSASGTTLAEPRTIATGLLTTETATTAAFELAPGDVTLHLDALGATGDTVDKWTRTITVPDFSSAAIALSTPRFLRARSPFELKALQSAAAPWPVASRDFRRTDRVFVETDCYCATAAPELIAELLNGSGKVLATLPIRTAAIGMPAPAEPSGRLELPMANLAIGSYVLRLRASAGGEHAQQLTAFRVVP